MPSSCRRKDRRYRSGEVKCCGTRWTKPFPVRGEVSRLKACEGAEKSFRNSVRKTRRSRRGLRKGRSRVARVGKTRCTEPLRPKTATQPSTRRIFNHLRILDYSEKVSGWAEKSIRNLIANYVLDKDYLPSQFHRQARAAWSTYGSRVKVTVAREMHFGTSPEWFVLKRLGLRMVGSDTPTTVLSARLKEWNEKHILSPRRNRPLGTVDPFLFWCHQCRLRFTGPSRTRRCETCRLLICGTRVSGGNRRHRSIVTNPVRPPSGG